MTGAGEDVVFYLDTGNTFHTPHYFSFVEPLHNPDLYKASIPDIEIVNMIFLYHCCLIGSSIFILLDVRNTLSVTVWMWSR